MYSTAQQDDVGKSYDEIPYPSLCHAHCQPTRLHAVAKLKGLNPPDVRCATILEIGCSFGGNLLPFAIQFPNSQIIGIDLSEYQITVGKKMLAEIGIENMQLFAGDISQVSFEDIQFDYIICHGVFSWVPENVQSAILACIQKHLSPNGVAYISYNAYPGWHYREKIRHFMLFDGQNKPKQDKVPHSLALLEFSKTIIDRLRINDSAFFSELYEKLLTFDPDYIHHEFFEKFNQPFYLSKFIEKIKPYQLKYISDSEIIDVRTRHVFNKQEYAIICEYYQHNPERIEQYFDFIVNSAFKMSLISHQNNISMNPNDYNLDCLNEVLFKDYFHYEIEENNGKSTAYWLGKTKLFSNPIADEICRQINEIDGCIQVSSLVSKINYPEQEIMHVLHKIILNANYLSFYPNPLQKYKEKPHICKKYRKLIQFIHHNPNITKLANCYYQTFELDHFSIYLAMYLDGTRSIDDLIKITDNALVSGELAWKIELSPNADKKQTIKEMILNTLAQFEQYGFFNHNEKVQ